MPTQLQSEILDVDKVAEILGISSATVRNWIRHGYINPINGSSRFVLNEIEQLKYKISNGEIERLNKRANKRSADRTFIPEEYVHENKNLDQIANIVSTIQNANITINKSLFLLTLNLLGRIPLIEKPYLEKIQIEQIATKNPQIKIELENWANTINDLSLNDLEKSILEIEMPNQRDILGVIYQSLLIEGKKAKNGSYYTPSNIVQAIVNDYAFKEATFLDPCCGTGQFLLSFADVIENPEKITGIDIDEIAVKIARINLIIHYRDNQFTPRIFHKNTLLDYENNDLFSLDNDQLGCFDVIATNPPWGIHFSKEEKDSLKSLYPSISSYESFSYFLKKSIDHLNENGISSFILPESILNVKTHEDIRKYILENTGIKHIFSLDRAFQNVFTHVVRLDLKKEKNGGNIFEVHDNGKSYKVPQKRLSKNTHLTFDIKVNGEDQAIIDKVFNQRHITLEGQADWALGIVTGNNKEYVLDEAKDGAEDIFKGKDIEKFVLKKASNYIYFTPEKFQQVAPTEKYRAPEKLIYKFISQKLVFAYDNEQKLTLNSANIVIPKIESYPMKAIAGFLNSSLYQFIFQKKFASIKVLRGHIEKMPLPFWTDKELEEVVNLVEEIISNKSTFESLDYFIMDKFGLSEKEKQFVLNNIH